MNYQKKRNNPCFWVTEKELREGPLGGSLAELFPSIFLAKSNFIFKNNTA